MINKSKIVSPTKQFFVYDLIGVKCEQKKRKTLVFYGTMNGGPFVWAHDGQPQENESLVK